MEFLRRLWKAWQNVVHFIANFIARLALTLFYFTVMLPFSIGVTLFGDPLKLKVQHNSNWISRQTPLEKVEEARRQF